MSGVSFDSGGVQQPRRKSGGGGSMMFFLAFLLIAGVFVVKNMGSHRMRSDNPELPPVIPQDRAQAPQDPFDAPQGRQQSGFTGTDNDPFGGQVDSRRSPAGQVRSTGQAGNSSDWSIEEVGQGSKGPVTGKSENKTAAGDWTLEEVETRRNDNTTKLRSAKGTESKPSTTKKGDWEITVD